MTIHKSKRKLENESSTERICINDGTLDHRMVQKALHISSFSRYCRQAEFLLEVFFEESDCRFSWLRSSTEDWTAILDLESEINLSNPRLNDVIEILTKFGRLPALVASYEGVEVIFPLVPGDGDYWETIDLDLGLFDLVENTGRSVELDEVFYTQGNKFHQRLVEIEQCSYFELIFAVFNAVQSVTVKTQPNCLIDISYNTSSLENSKRPELTK